MNKHIRSARKNARKIVSEARKEGRLVFKAGQTYIFPNMRLTEK